MGAKRAVAGRSLPYDMLLAAYQKKNQAKQQSKISVYSTSLFEELLLTFAPPTTEAALDANAPVEDEDETNAGPIDSDEETAAVMSALARWKPQPVVPQPVFAPIKRQYQLARLHEQLAMATSGGRTNIFSVQGYGAGKAGADAYGDAPGEDAPGEPDVSFGGGPMRAGSYGMGAPPSRRTSVTSRG
jgi:SAGA-associated factor 73